MTECIDKKEYLGRTDLAEFVVPCTVCEIGDWAFAQCAGLKRIAIPKGVKAMGKGVFDGCDLLEAIYVYGAEDTEFKFRSCSKEEKALAEMCVYAFKYFQSPDLSDLSAVGSEAWIRAWDEACIRFLEAEDDEGFSPFLAGGEEDYDEQLSDRAYYEHERRRKKAAVSIERMLAEPFFSMEERVKEKYETFLSRHGSEVCEVMAGVTHDIRIMVLLFGHIGLLDGDRGNRLLETIPDTAVELRSLLMERVKSTPDFVL